MSDSSVINITQCLVDTNVDKFLSKEGMNYLLKERFMVGCGHDANTVNKLLELNKILQFSNCSSDLDENKIREEIYKLTY